MSRPASFVASVAGGFVPELETGSRPGSLRWKEEVLATVPLFAGISRRHRRSVARIAGLARFDSGDQVVASGGVGDTFGVLVDGTLRVVKNGRTVARLHAGDFFGEISLLDPGPRTASLVGDEGGRFLGVRAKELQRLLATEAGV
jgi:CRP/FNR family cyclic AMP-dependent transcriptional regulator